MLEESGAKKTESVDQQSLIMRNHLDSLIWHQLSCPQEHSTGRLDYKEVT